jgi:hypothetical protein
MPVEIRQGRREDADGSAVYEMVSTTELTAVALLAGLSTARRARE